MSDEPQHHNPREVVTNHVPLIRALIDAFLFLESGGDDEVDPDSAVRCMEHMAASLLELSPSDQLALRSELLRIADDDDDKNGGRDPAYARVVRSIPDAVGLADA